MIEIPRSIGDIFKSVYINTSKTIVDRYQKVQRVDIKRVSSYINVLNQSNLHFETEYIITLKISLYFNHTIIHLTRNTTQK